jgi:hypothetical protein
LNLEDEGERLESHRTFGDLGDAPGEVSEDDQEHEVAAGRDRESGFRDRGRIPIGSHRASIVWTATPGS